MARQHLENTGHKELSSTERDRLHLTKWQPLFGFGKWLPIKLAAIYIYIYPYSQFLIYNFILVYNFVKLKSFGFA